MTVITGFDPGLSGAACALLVGEMGGIELIDCIDLPTRADGSNRALHIAPLGRWLENIAPDLAIIENVQPMGGTGKDSRPMMGSAAFRFGMACGALRGALEAYEIPIRLVVPVVWKRAAGLLKQGKEASRQKALLDLPAAASFLKRRLDHNRAEACLIALWAANQKGML
jgi:hypothetical protein